MSPKKSDSLHCSFCGKGQREVKKLIAGPNVYICDECIQLCNDIIAEEVEKEKAQAGHQRRWARDGGNAPSADRAKGWTLSSWCLQMPESQFNEFKKELAYCQRRFKSIASWIIAYASR